MATTINTMSIINDTNMKIPVGMPFMLSTDGVTPITTASLDSNGNLDFNGVDLSAYEQVNLYLFTAEVPSRQSSGATSVPSTPTAPAAPSGSEWGANLPYGPTWVEGYYVGYAITFVNQIGESAMSSFSGGEVIGYARPLITSIPVSTDVTEGVYARNLYRLVSPNQDLSGGETVLVACLNDNTTSSYRDESI